MEYTVIEHDSLNEFIALVNAAIAEGWRPQGGIGFAKVWKSQFTQAMIRDRSTNKN